jgi:hypothetical protein
MTRPEFVDWLKHGWGVQARTPEQLFRIISNIALLQNDGIYAWRGQNDAGYQFSSSLYRELSKAGTVSEDAMRSREGFILDEARKWGLGKELGSSATDLHLLASLQHHGVPTRLIDVTSDPMTALWFATEEHKPDSKGVSKKTPGALIAINVSQMPWYETFQHSGGTTYGSLMHPLSAAYEEALGQSASNKSNFRVYSALPDERMKAQQGYFIGSAIPANLQALGVHGIHLPHTAPGEDRLKKLMNTDRSPGRPVTIPFCAIIISNSVKEKLRDPLKRTYNRRRRVLFPDAEGFREAFARNQLD